MSSIPPFRLIWRWYLLGLFSLFLLPILLIRPFLFQSLWLDEASSVWFARLPIQTQLTALCDPHPPGYYLLLKFWLQAGKQEFWLRWPSLLTALLAGAFTFRLGKRISGRRWYGWLAGLLLLWHPLQIWYAAEVRMYMLVQLFGVMALWLGWKLWLPDTIKKKQNGLALLYWLVATAALWLDYSAVFALGLLQLLWLLRGRPKAGLWILLQAAVFLPVLLMLISSRQLMALSQTYQPIFLAIQASRFGFEMTLDDAIILLRLAFVGMGLISFIIAWYWPRWHKKFPPWTDRIISILIIVGWLLLLLSSAIPRLFTIKRLLIVMLPYLALLTMYALSRWARWVSYGIVGLSLLITAFILPSHQREPWRDIMGTVQQTLAVQSGVVWVDELVVPAFDFYADGIDDDRWTPLFARQLPRLPELNPLPEGSLWLVTSNSPYRQLTQLLPAEFYEMYEGEVIVEEVGILIYEYQRRVEGEMVVPVQTVPPTMQELWGLQLPSPLDTCDDG